MRTSFEKARSCYTKRIHTYITHTHTHMSLTHSGSHTHMHIHTYHSFIHTHTLAHLNLLRISLLYSFHSISSFSHSSHHVGLLHNTPFSLSIFFLFLSVEEQSFKARKTSPFFPNIKLIHPHLVPTPVFVF